MNRRIALMVEGSWLCLALLVGSYTPATAEYSENRDCAEYNIRREITLLHLINGLELSADQMRFILQRAYHVRDLRQQLLSQEQSRDTCTALEQFRSKLMRQEPIEPTLWRQVTQLQLDKHQLEAQVTAEVTRLAKEVEAQLDGHQRYALGDYVPCVIPPPGESKIGQAAGGGLVRGLERLRRLPDQLYRAHRLQIAQRTVDRLSYKLPPGYEFSNGPQQELERIASIFDQARSLPEVGFAVQKEQLAEQLGAPYDVRRHGDNTTTKVARHLLCPEIIPLLDDRLSAVQ